LRHDSGSRYARKSVDGSKDVNDSLVSKKYMSQKMARWVGTQGQAKLAKNPNTSPDYDVTHRKPQTQIKNNSLKSKVINAEF